MQKSVANDLAKQKKEKNVQTGGQGAPFANFRKKIIQLDASDESDKETWEDIQNNPERYFILSEKEYAAPVKKAVLIVIKYLQNMDYTPDTDDR